MRPGSSRILTCWTIPFLRAAEALLEMGVFREPSYVQFSFCEGGILGGHPCTIDGALAFANMLPREKRIEWTVTCKEGNLLPAAAVALERGGHISTGIGDYIYPELDYPSNAKLIEFFAGLGARLRPRGGEPSGGAGHAGPRTPQAAASHAA